MKLIEAKIFFYKIFAVIIFSLAAVSWVVLSVSFLKYELASLRRTPAAAQDNSKRLKIVMAREIFGPENLPYGQEKQRWAFP